MCEVSGEWWGDGGGMWSRHTFSLTRLEPTRTGVGSPGAKMDSVVGGRNQRFERGERWRGESERGGIGGRPERNRESKAREVQVCVGSSGEDRSIGKGEGHGWELGRAHEVCKRGEDRLTKEYMGSAGVGEYGRRGDRTQQGSIVTIVVVGMVGFQRGEGVRVREARDW